MIAWPLTTPSPMKEAMTSEFARFTATAAPTAALPPTAKPDAIAEV